MLCRTANELYWMGRHIERAENVARLLDVTNRMSLLPYELVEPGLAWAEPWAVPLVTSGLGTHIERADNTARILDVKYHTLLPSAADVGGAVDYYQWSALLRCLSGFESYRKIYSDVITPRRVAELLILREDMPRSLHSCMNFIHETLKVLCDENSKEIERVAGELHAKLQYGRTDEIIKLGLHEYLMDFLDSISELGGEINTHFLVPG